VEHHLREAEEETIMSSNKELRVWVIVGVGLLVVMLGWLMADQLLWSTEGTPEEVGRHLQRHGRLMRYGIGVCVSVGIIGMTRWVYWALCRALDTANNEEWAIEQMDAQAWGDLCTRWETEYDVDHDRDA
jgi:hypothetical protein